MNSIFVVFAIFDFIGFQVQSTQGIGILILQMKSKELCVLIDHHGLQGSALQSLHGILHAVDDHMGVLGDLLVELGADLLFPCESLAFHALGRQFDCLVQTVLAPVGSVYDFYYFREQTRVEFLVFVHNCFEVCATPKHQTTDIRAVVAYENLSC